MSQVQENLARPDSRQKSRQKQANLLRQFRLIHRYAGAFLFAVFFLVAVTGLLLGWKKNTGDLILAKTRTGTSTELADWRSLAELRASALAYYRDSIYEGTGEIILDRIDVRPEKGIVKFVIEPGFWGLQVDGATAEILHVERRRSDFIEKVHDGSIVDVWLGIDSGSFKLFYTSLTGLALLLFTITGFWLWYGPKRMRRTTR